MAQSTRSLTDQQESFVRVYLETGDKLQAVKEGYPDAENPRQLAYKILRSRAVRMRIAQAKGDISLGDIVANLHDEMENGKGAPRVQASIALMRLCGFWPTGKISVLPNGGSLQEMGNAEPQELPPSLLKRLQVEGE